MKGKSIFKLVVFGSALLMVMGLNLVFASAEKVLYVSGDPNELGVTTFNPIKVELSHDAMWLIFDRFIEKDSSGKFYVLGYQRGRPGMEDETEKRSEVSRRFSL